jgi:hypothetical protein
MSEPTFRCGWRIQRELEPWRPDIFHGAVFVRRGEFRMQMPAEFFDATADTDFADYISRAYRDVMFQQLQADLDVLARQLIGELNATGELAKTDVPVDDVKDALYRWQRAELDMEEPTL